MLTGRQADRQGPNYGGILLVAAYLKAPKILKPQQNTLFDMFVAESSSISIPWMTDDP